MKILNRKNFYRVYSVSIVSDVFTGNLTRDDRPRYYQEVRSVVQLVCSKNRETSSRGVAGTRFCGLDCDAQLSIAESIQ
jgi:hypothetical protein